jgi:signal transduction histidine kinase
LAIKYDITQQKKAEQQLREKNKDLEMSNATKDRLFSIIAHDLRSPVGSLDKFLEVVSHARKNADEEDFERLISQAKAISRNAYYLLVNLLDWARSQQDNITVDPEPVQVKEHVVEVLEIYHEAIQAKGIQIQLSFPDNGKAVFVDKNMLSTILRNLVSNAIKFTPVGGEIAISCKNSGSYGEIQVKDNGVGMSQDKQLSLFSFTQNKSTFGTNGEVGTGLGLVLVHDFVVKNNGELSVESKEGEGTSITVVLPMA